CLGEPIVLTHAGDGAVHCLSNVCTHRGNLVVAQAGSHASLRCGYHGRRFALDGRFLAMPEFRDALSFPRAADDLPQLPLERWQRFLFTSLAPTLPFADWIGPMAVRVGGLPLASLRPDPSRTRAYDVAASWALYCDNYLEGFHVPFVHTGLAGEIEYES